MVSGGLIPLVIIVAIIGPRIYETMLNDALSHQESANKYVAARVTAEIERFITLLENKSDPISDLLASGGSQDRLLSLIKKILQREHLIHAVVVLDTNGKVLVANSRYQGAHEAHSGDQWTWFGEQIANKSLSSFTLPQEGNIYIGPVMVSKGRFFNFPIGIALSSSEKSLGMLLVEVAGEHLWRNIQKDISSENIANSFLIDRRGNMLTPPQNSDLHVGQLLTHIDIVRSIITSGIWDTRRVYRNMAGVSVFGTVTRIPSVGWQLISETPQRLVLDPIYVTLSAIILMIALVVMIFIWGGVVIAGRMLMPVEKLSEAFSRAAKQDYSAAQIVSPISEFQRLASGFDVMVNKIQNHEQQLLASQQELEEVEERFRQLAENINEVLLIVSVNWQEIVYVSPAYEKIWGMSCASLYKKPGLWLSSMHPVDRGRINIVIEELAMGSSSARFQEFRIITSTGEVKWIKSEVYPVRDLNDKIFRYVVVAQDVSQYREAQTEQERLHQQLQQSQKMEAIGQLTGGIAHDFNNMLTAIMGYTSLALERFSATADPKLLEYLTEVNIAGERARELISQLLVFSREGISEPVPLALPPVIKEATKMLQTSLPANINIWTQVGSEVPQVLMDPVRLHQIVMNLCINARDAIEGEGSITISVEYSYGVDTKCAGCHTSFGGNYVVLGVRDTGRGIDPAILDRIFDPFFTTKGIGKGTGMGLSIVHGIVHDLGGHVLVETGPAGTLFQLLFPVYQETEEKPKEKQIVPVQAGEGSGQHILIIDDEEAVARFESELLSHHGYQTTVMTNSRAALVEFRDNPGKYDLVVTDQTMPGLMGGELATALLAIQPDLPIILYTGFSNEMDAEMAKDIGIREFCLKPVRSDVLLNMVRGLLQSQNKIRISGA